MKVDSVLFYRYFLAVLMMGGLMLVRKESFALRRAEVLPMIVMGLLFSSSSLFLFEAYNYMDAGVASTFCLSTRSWWLSSWPCSSTNGCRR